MEHCQDGLRTPWTMVGSNGEMGAGDCALVVLSLIPRSCTTTSLR